MRLLYSVKYHLWGSIGYILLFICTMTIFKFSYAWSDEMTLERSISSTQYFLAEAAVCGILAHLLASLPLYYIEKYIDFAVSIRREVVIKCVLLICLGQVLYSLIVWPVLSMLEFMIRERVTVTQIERMINVFYFASLHVIWLFAVVAIRIYYNLQQVKIKGLLAETHLQEAQLSNLKSQINPHFMFNALNNIRGLILESPAKARDMLTRLSELLRYALSMSKVNKVSLEAELEVVDNFINIIKIQLEARLQFEQNVDDALLSIQIPPMIIQMLVENAVKHGIADQTAGGKVRLNVHRTAEEVVIEVRNTGQYSLKGGDTHVGLENIRGRLALLYGNDASFDLQQDGVEVAAVISINAKCI